MNWIRGSVPYARDGARHGTWILVLVTLLTGLTAVPVIASTDPASPLTDWKITADITFTSDEGRTQVSPYRIKVREVSTLKHAPGADTGITWNAERDDDTGCDTQSGGGSGSGRLELSSSKPAEYGYDLDLTRDWTVLRAQASTGFQMSGTINCGETPFSQEVHPVSIQGTGIFLPGTGEDLAAAPVGTTHELTYGYDIRSDDGDFFSHGTISISYVATKVSDGACVVGEQYKSDDTFYAFTPGYDEPALSFELYTQWCLDATDNVIIQYVTPTATLLQSPLESAFAAAIRELTTVHSKSGSVTYSIDGDMVTASAEFRDCFGIPIIGKVKWVKKLAKAFRFVASLLRTADGKLAKVAVPIAKLMDKAALAVDWAVRNGGSAAKWAGKKAIGLVAKAIGALPRDPQMKVLLLTVGALADHHSSAKWAQQYLKGLPGKGATYLIEKQDALPRLLSDELVCFSSWKPRIRQTLGTAGAKGSFIDRSGDYDAWIVQDHPLPPLSVGLK